jgi:hypothetical protein
MNTITQIPTTRPTRTYPAWHTGTVVNLGAARIQRDNKLRASIWPVSDSMREQIQQEARRYSMSRGLSPYQCGQVACKALRMLDSMLPRDALKSAYRIADALVPDTNGVA